jgi:hypothetical protein
VVEEEKSWAYARMVAMPGRLSEQWSNEAFRRSATIALRLWNRALLSGSGPEQQHAVRTLQQLWTPTDAVRATEAAAGSAPAETAETIDRLLDFPSHRLAVYGSLAPGKQNCQGFSEELGQGNERTP